MIFLTLLAAGALAGLAATHLWPSAAGPATQAHRAAAGAFLTGGLAVGLARREVGALDPIALAAGIVGALVFVFALGRLDRSAPHRSTRRRSVATIAVRRGVEQPGSSSGS